MKNKKFLRGVFIENFTVLLLTEPYVVPQLSIHKNKQVATPCILICPTLTVVLCRIAVTNDKG
jgi:hypothetical protein